MFILSVKIVLESKTYFLFSSFTKVLFSVCLAPWRQRALLNKSFAPLIVAQSDIKLSKADAIFP